MPLKQLHHDVWRDTELLELLLVGELFQIAVRRRDDANVDRYRTSSANRQHLASLEHAQERGLRLRETAPQLRRGRAFPDGTSE